ncbi:MAG: TonB-dependent receptor plug domain-containing protein [Rhodothalassiaceae bacterium]
MRRVGLVAATFASCSGWIFTLGLAVAAPASPPAGPVLGPLSEITVTGRRGGREPLAPRTRIDAAELEALDAAGVDALLGLVPAANIQTNSRGERLVFLRNAGERQVAVFLDGALLNVPWDNRIDLSLVPAAAIARLGVVCGVAPAEYGANVIGGAVNVITRSALDGMGGPFLAVGGGSAGRLDIDGRTGFASGDTGFVIGAGYHRHGDVPLASGALLPFNQEGSRRRSNTDARAGQLYARAEHRRADGGALSASVLVVGGEKGVAPEGHVPPEDARFWRYPDWRLRMGILAGDGEATGGILWKASLWAQSFGQTIDSFRWLALVDLEERQRDDNMTYGARLIASRDFAFGRLLYAVNGLISTHDQQNEPADAPPQALRFRQWTLSQGLEVELSRGEGFDLSVGAGLDLMGAPRTGDKPPVGDFATWTLAIGARQRLASDWTLGLAFGRKTRFPTMRELFGTALNRFLVNPGLRPESAMLAELSLEGHWSTGSVSLSPFARFVDDGIDQRRVSVDGRSLRQRINLAGSRTLGVELTGTLMIGSRTTLEGHATWMNTRGRRNAADPRMPLAEKPRLLARAALAHRTASGLAGRLEIVHRGRAFSLDPADILVPLRVSTSLNLRLSHALGHLLPRLAGSELYVRIDNLTDRAIEPQAGLPAAGRWVQGGLRITL